MPNIHDNISIVSPNANDLINTMIVAGTILIPKIK